MIDVAAIRARAEARSRAASDGPWQCPCGLNCLQRDQSCPQGHIRRGADMRDQETAALCDRIERIEQDLATANANWSSMHNRALDQIRAAAGLDASATVPDIVARIAARLSDTAT